MDCFNAVIFDLGDTLVYFDGVWEEVLNQAEQQLVNHLVTQGFTITPAEFLSKFHHQMQTYYQERDTEFIEYTTRYIFRKTLEEVGLVSVPESSLRSALDDYYAVFQSHWQPEEDAIETLRLLKAKGFRLGLVSNTSDDANVQYLIDKAQIRSFFDQIITSAAIGIRKPNPRIFQPLLSDWKFLPGQVVMVGDTLGADILGARNAGMAGIWITRRADTPANHAHSQTIFPDATISNLLELPLYLERC